MCSSSDKDKDKDIVGNTLQGQTALITGGASGIGLSTAQLFVEEGANVVIAGRRTDALDKAVHNLGAPERVRSFMADVSSEGHANTLVANTVRAFGALNILVNNAGIFRGGPLLEMEEDDFDENITINLKGTWLMCRYAARPLIEAGGGAIINVSSYLAIRAHHSTPASGYAASKAGILGLTRSLAVELAPYKVRVNAVLPAVVKTPMLTELVPPEQVDALLERSKKAHPLGRAGEPEDVARAILFLAQPQNSWVTGAELPVDGGRAVI
ncbi:MAG TPA: SDR family NAD(P)-dependent oxidoreductase [Candidatus Obscuribacterales bacterium]